MYIVSTRLSFPRISHLIFAGPKDEGPTAPSRTSASSMEIGGTAESSTTVASSRPSRPPITSHVAPSVVGGGGEDEDDDDKTDDTQRPSTSTHPFNRLEQISTASGRSRSNASNYVKQKGKSKLKINHF